MRSESNAGINTYEVLLLVKVKVEATDRAVGLFNARDEFPTLVAKAEYQVEKTEILCVNGPAWEMLNLDDESYKVLALFGVVDSYNNVSEEDLNKFATLLRLSKAYLKSYQKMVSEVVQNHSGKAALKILGEWITETVRNFDTAGIRA